MQRIGINIKEKGTVRQVGHSSELYRVIPINKTQKSTVSFPTLYSPSLHLTKPHSMFKNARNKKQPFGDRISFLPQVRY
jgi:hypothetical protein